MGVEIVIATPGRLIDVLESGTTNLWRVTAAGLERSRSVFLINSAARVCTHSHTLSFAPAPAAHHVIVDGLAEQRAE
jgi:hypothetical protein